MQQNSQLTNERLAHIYRNLKRWADYDNALNSYISGQKIDPIFHDCVVALAELQECRKAAAEPAYYVISDGDGVEFNAVDEFSCGRRGGQPLYTVPPVPIQVDELTMWVKRLAHSLKYANQLSKLPRDAMEYLSRKGLISVEDVLR